MMKIIILDDHLLTGQTMEAVLQEQYKVDVSSYSPVNFDFDLLNNCDLLVLDYDFGDFGDAYDILETLDTMNLSDLKIILLSSYKQSHVLMTCRHKLVRAYVNKINEVNDLFSAIDAVMANETWYAPECEEKIKRILALPQKEVPTKRELEIIRLERKNLSREAIAEKLNISIRTVNNHCTSIFRKLGINASKEL